MKNDLVYLEHIDEFCSDLKDYLYELNDFEEFKNNKLYQDAIIRKLEIIGEASKNISEELKNKYPEIPWKEMKALRNVIVHEYFGINYAIIWEVLTKRIPILHNQIKEIIKDKK
jgi:uncharacterized protein with HEPN domain